MRPAFGSMGLLAIAFAAAMATGAPARGATDSIDGFIYRTRPVTDRVHMIYRPVATDPPFEGNVTVVEQRAGLVVVDAGGTPLSGQRVVRQIRAISRKPVRFLIYTHYHGDHNLGAGAFLRAWPDVRIVSTEATRRNMTGKPMAYIGAYSKGYADTLKSLGAILLDPKASPALKAGVAHFEASGPGIIDAYKDLQAYPADVTFSDHMTLQDDAAPVEVMFLGPANTDGDAVVWLPKQRVVASGDVVTAPIPYAASSFPRTWIEAIRRIEALDYAYLVPGHGELQTDHAYLDRVIAALQSVRDQVGPLAAQGLSLEETRKRIRLDEIKRAFAGDDAWYGFLMDNVFLGALVANAYAEAKGLPIVQGA